MRTIVSCEKYRNAGTNTDFKISTRICRGQALALALAPIKKHRRTIKQQET